MLSIKRAEASLRQNFILSLAGQRPEPVILATLKFSVQNMLHSSKSQNQICDGHAKERSGLKGNPC